MKLHLVIRYLEGDDRQSHPHRFAQNKDNTAEWKIYIKVAIKLYLGITIGSATTAIAIHQSPVLQDEKTTLFIVIPLLSISI